MRQGRPQTFRQVSIPAPSRLDWNDEKLAQLNAEQLKNLLANLDLQRSIGRISAEAASELSQRIAARLPARALTVRRTRSRVLTELDGRVARDLGDFAARLGRQYDLTDGTAREKSIDVPGFRPEVLTDKRGLAKVGNAVKKGNMVIDRAISYRVRDSIATLAFVLLPDQPQETGRYVILATEDLLESGLPITDVLPASRDHGWSGKSRGAMRAQPALNFAEAQVVYEGLIAKLAKARDPEQ